MATKSSNNREKKVSQNDFVTDLMDSSPVYSTDYGATYKGDSLELLTELPDSSIDLIVTSPPFALQNEKEYGNKDQESYNDWFMDFIPEICRVLQPHGSFIVEIGGAFKKGRPERSIYQWKLLTRIVEETNLKFAQDWYWYNPSKLPSPIEWVNVRKLRGVDSVTHIWWFTKQLNKDPAYTDELQDKVESIEYIRDQFAENLSDEQLLKITESILLGDQNSPQTKDSKKTDQELITESACGDLEVSEYASDGLVKNLLTSVRNSTEEEWSKKYNLDHQTVVNTLKFTESNDSRNPYDSEVKELILDTLPNYWTLYIHDLVIRTNKAPSVYAREVMTAIEEGNSIRRPYPKPEVNNQRNKKVLKSYSEHQEDLIETGEFNDGQRSSGHNIDDSSFANKNDGAISKNIITASNTASNTHYQRMCRKYGIDRHPARFPKDIPQKFINLLTPDPPYDKWERGHSDNVGYLSRPIVLDIFGGSNWTGKIAEDARRYWLSFERDEVYAKTSELRFRSEDELDEMLQNELDMRALAEIDKRPGRIRDLEPRRCEYCGNTFKAHCSLIPEIKYCSPKCYTNGEEL